MTIRTLASLIAAGTLTSFAANAQSTYAPDPNVGPSTVEEESTLDGTPEGAQQLSTAPDGDLAPSTVQEEEQLPASSPDKPQLATDPDPDFGEATGE